MIKIFFNQDLFKSFVRWSPLGCKKYIKAYDPVKKTMPVILTCDSTEEMQYESNSHFWKYLNQ